MIVRIARVKVGHCQTPHTRKPDSKESGFLLSAGMGVKDDIRRGIALRVILDKACRSIPEYLLILIGVSGQCSIECRTCKQEGLASR